jgi:hypothetical protein
MGFVNVFNEYGRWLFYSGGSQVFRYEDRALYYGNLVEGSLSRLSLPEEPSIYFHTRQNFHVKIAAQFCRVPAVYGQMGATHSCGSIPSTTFGFTTRVQKPMEAWRVAGMS